MAVRYIGKRRNKRNYESYRLQASLTGAVLPKEGFDEEIGLTRTDELSRGKMQEALLQAIERKKKELHDGY